MKKIFLALTGGLLLLPAAPAGLAAADPMGKLTKELIMKELDAKMGAYKDQWDYWNGIKNDIVTGDIDSLVNKAVDEAVRQTKEKLQEAKDKTSNWEIGWTIFEKLAPEALAPIAVLKGTSEFVHDRTQAWLDWAIKNREEDFYNMVLDPEKSPDVARLDANWNDYETWIVPTGEADHSVLYVKRKDVLAKNKANYQKRRTELAEKENRRSSAQSIAELKTKLAKRLNAIRRDTEREVKDGSYLLGLAKLPQTEENILRYMNDIPFRNELVRKWWKQVEDHQAAVDADTPLGKAAQIMVQAEDKPSQAPDYSGVLKEYGLNSDRFATNNIAASEFTTVRDALESAASALAQSCVDTCRGMVEQSPERKGCYNGCEAALKDFSDRREQVNKNLGDLLASARAQLEVRRADMDKKPLEDYYNKLASEYNSLSWAGEKEREDGLIDSCGKGDSDTCVGAWQVGWEYYWSGVQGTPPKRLIKLEEMRKNSERLAHTAAVYASLSGPAAQKGKDFQNRAAAYQQELAAEMSKYAELYQKSDAMAQFMKIPCYDFATQTRSLNEAMRRFSDTHDFVSPLYLNALYTGKNRALKERAAWEEEIAANEKELPAARQSVAGVEGLAAWSYKGKKEKLDLKFLETYFDAEWKPFLVDFLQGALVLLDESIKGALYDNSNNKQYAPFGGTRKPVSEISASPSYVSLAEHRAKLEEFGKKMAELKELDLEQRLVKAEAAYASLSDSAKKMRVPSEELIKLVQTAQQLRGGMGRLATPGLSEVYKGGRTLDYPTMEAAYTAYEKKIKAAEEYEKGAIEACQRAKADPKFDYRDFTSALLGAGKWKPAKETERACAEANGAKYDAEEKAYRKFTPFAEATVAGRPLAAGELNLKASDLPGGKVRVRGTLVPDTADYRQVYITLNGDFGSLYKAQLADIANGAFDYEFEPKPGETYYIAVKALGPDGLASVPLPGGGAFLTLKYEQGDKTEEIRAFYDKFREAYEGRSVPGVMALISPDWGAGAEDVSVQDLEENLRANFRLYDEIRFSLSGLKVTTEGGAYRACYETLITSRIFKRNLKHEEKSSVCDQLKREGGKLRIARTLSGSYWYVK